MSSPQFYGSTPPTPIHPFANTKNLLEIIPNDNKIDIEEEARLYNELCCEVDYDRDNSPRFSARPFSPPNAPSVFSKDIWLENSIGESQTFARDVKITGWINVGDKLGGAYVVYDCAITTKEGTIIHAHKRYSAFEQLFYALTKTLPKNQLHYLPCLPPKAPFARYRPAFLDRRRRLLQQWLTAVLLHPDLGSTKAVRLWVMD